MKNFAVLLVIWVASASAATDSWDGLSLKFADATNPDAAALKNIDWIYNVPKTIDEEVESGNWVEIELDNYYNLKALAFESSNDYGLNSLYDCNGILAGIQACQPYDIIKLTGPPNYDPLTIENSATELILIDGKEYICSSLLFISPETIMEGGRTSFTKTGDGLWIRNTANTDTGYDKVTDSISELLSTTLFTEQNCVPLQGTHYLYNISTEYDCTKFYTWFLIGDQTTDTINGAIFNLFGEPTMINKNYYDNLTSSSIKYVVPNANECLYDWTDIYNLVSIHIFFTDYPERITCAEGDAFPTS